MLRSRDTWYLDPPEDEDEFDAEEEAYRRAEAQAGEDDRL